MAPRTESAGSAAATAIAATILRPVDRLGYRHWEVEVTTLDGDEETIVGPTAYREVVAAEKHMTSVARATPPDEDGVQTEHRLLTASNQRLLSANFRWHTVVRFLRQVSGDIYFIRPVKHK